MSHPKVRDLAIAIAVLLASVAYATSAVERTIHYTRLDGARKSCARQNDNASNLEGYYICMTYAGFQNEVPLR